MKAKELKELKEMSVADLEKKLKALKEEIFDLDGEIKHFISKW